MKSSLLPLVICWSLTACAPPVAAPLDARGPDLSGPGTAATGGAGGSGGNASGGNSGGTGGGGVAGATGGATGGTIVPTNDAAATNIDASGVADQAWPDTSATDVAPADAGAADQSGDAGNNGWWDGAWTKRAKITIADPLVVEELMNFQIPVKLDAAGIDTQSARAGGLDLRFVDEAGNLLAHEIDAWDPNGTSVVWLRLPKLTGAPVVVWLYYGNPAAAAPTVATTRAVWPAPYAGVWHLSGDAKDSTANAFDGMTMMGGSFPAARFGRGLKLNGAQRDHIVLKNNIKILGGAAGCTFSAWINPTNIENSVNGVVIMTLGKWFTNNHNSYADFNVNAAGQMISHIDSGPNTGASGYERINSIAGLIKAAEWVWVTYVIDLAASEERFFKNGQLVDTKKPPSGSFPTRTFIDMVSSRVVIGTEEDNVSHWYTGDMDEMRIETTMRTPGWIAAQYRAMTVAGVVNVEREAVR